MTRGHKGDMEAGLEIAIVHLCIDRNKEKSKNIHVFHFHLLHFKGRVTLQMT